MLRVRRGGRSRSSASAASTGSVPPAPSCFITQSCTRRRPRIPPARFRAISNRPARSLCTRGCLVVGRLRCRRASRSRCPRTRPAWSSRPTCFAASPETRRSTGRGSRSRTPTPPFTRGGHRAAESFRRYARTRSRRRRIGARWRRRSTSTSPGPTCTCSVAASRRSSRRARDQVTLLDVAELGLRLRRARRSRSRSRAPVTFSR